MQYNFHWLLHLAGSFTIIVLSLQLRLREREWVRVKQHPVTTSVLFVFDSYVKRVWTNARPTSGTQHWQTKAHCIKEASKSPWQVYLVPTLLQKCQKARQFSGEISLDGQCLSSLRVQDLRRLRPIRVERLQQVLWNEAVQSWEATAGVVKCLWHSDQGPRPSLSLRSRNRDKKQGRRHCSRFSFYSLRWFTLYHNWFTVYQNKYAYRPYSSCVCVCAV